MGREECLFTINLNYTGGPWLFANSRAFLHIAKISQTTAEVYFVRHVCQEVNDVN